MNAELIKVLGDLAIALSPLVIAAISALAAYFAKLINEKAKNELLKSGLTKLDHLIFTVVMELEQTMVSEFKKVSADGKLSDEDKKALKDAALNKLKSYFSLDAIMKLFGLANTAIAEDLLSSKIEAAVKSVKNDPLA
jgi:DNA-binding protein Fis